MLDEEKGCIVMGLDVLYNLFLKSLSTRDIEPIASFLSEMSKTHLQTRMQWYEFSISKTGIISTLWSCPKTVSHPNFDDMIDLLIEKLLQYLTCPDENTPNNGLPSQHHLISALKSQEWDFLRDFFDILQSAFDEYPWYQPVYLNRLQLLMQEFNEIIHTMSDRDFEHCLELVSKFVRTLFLNKSEFYNFLSQFHVDKILGEKVFSTSRDKWFSGSRLYEILMKLIEDEMIDMNWVIYQFVGYRYRSLSLIDKIILNAFDNPVVFKDYLIFMESLYTRKFLHQQQYANFILNHVRDGYSPLHELIYLGRPKQLKVYFEFIYQSYKNGHLLWMDIDKTLNSPNINQFSPLAQATNNSKIEITRVFFDFCHLFYTRDEFINLLKRNISFMRCASSKPDAQEINKLMARYKNQIYLHNSAETLIVEASLDSSLELSKTYLDLSFLENESEGSLKFYYSEFDAEQSEKYQTIFRRRHGLFDQRISDRRTDALQNLSFNRIGH